MLKLKYRDFFLIKEKFMLGKKILKKKEKKIHIPVFYELPVFFKKGKKFKHVTPFKKHIVQQFPYLINVTDLL